MPLRVQQRGKAAISAGFLFVVSLFVTAYSVKNPALARIGSAAVAEVLMPLQLVSFWLRGSFSGWWSSYVELIDAKGENINLKKRLLKLEAENSRLMEFESENIRLTSLLRMSEEMGLSGVVARVVGYDASQWVQTITIDKGTNAGVQMGMAVTEAHGIVGQVMAAGYSTAKVLLIIDHISGVDAIIQSSRARGIVSGVRNLARGIEPICVLRYVLKDEKVSVGDRAITSGMDGVFPKGFLIGIVSEVGKPADDFMHAITVKPAVNFPALENVFVITQPPRNQDSIKTAEPEP